MGVNLVIKPMVSHSFWLAPVLKRPQKKLPKYLTLFRSIGSLPSPPALHAWHAFPGSPARCPVSAAGLMQQARPAPRSAKNPASIESHALVGQFDDVERWCACVIRNRRNTLPWADLDNLNPVG